MDNPLNLPDDDGVMVWCERCQRIHKRVTFSRRDYERVITAQNLADAIDAEAMRQISEQLGWKK